MDKRLFVAIKLNPSEEFLQRIYLFKENLRADNINWIPQDHYHVTLKFLGGTPESKIPQLIQRIQKIVSKTACFSLSVDRLALFGSKYHPRVIWFAIQDSGHVILLHDELEFQLRSLGFSSQAGNYIPHLSIARIRKLEDKTYFHQVMDAFEYGAAHTQNIEKILLFESVLRPKGAEYHVLEEFYLGDQLK